MKALYIWIDQLNRFLWEKVVRSTYSGSESLSAFRIVVGTFLLATYLPHFSWIGEMPKAFFYPPTISIANLFTTFPDQPFFRILDGVVLLSLICLTLGIKARVSAIVFLGACVVGLSFQYSFGKISHSILAYTMFGCMAFSGWGRHLALLPDRESKVDNTARCLSLFSILICFGMFTAGLQKAWHWVDFDLAYNGVLSWSQGSIFRDYKYHLLAPYFKFLPNLLIEVLDYTAVLFELSPLFCLLYSKKAWKFWLMLACCFHLANTILLNIPFPLHVIVYLAFADFTWLYQKIKIGANSYYAKRVTIALLASIVTFRLWSFFVNTNIFAEFFEIDELILLNLYFCIVLWTTAFAIFLNELRQPHRLEAIETPSSINLSE